MKNIINVSITKGDKYYIAECFYLPVVSQGVNLDETVANINEAIQLHLEDEDLSELGYSKKPIININIDMGEIEYA